MAASRLRFVVVFVIITLIHFRLYSAEIERHSLNDVIVAASNVIKYFKQNYQTLSFDGHFGVRVMEGQLKLLLAEYEKGYHRTVPATVMTQLRQLAEEAAKVGNMAVPHLLDQDPRTFNMVRYQVQNPWTMFHSHRMTDASQRWESSSFQHLKDISEEDRDKCVAELTGATSKSNKKCSVSASCLRLMLSYGRHGYSLQQQIIYVAFVEKVGCSSTIDDFLRSEGGVGTTVERVQQMFCSNAYYELSKNIFLYGLQPSFRDLFIQAQFTCPNLGFFEFLQHDWLNLILSWQKESGCYTLGVGQPIQEKGSCHDYMTGLATSALAMYIRFMVDPGPVEFHHLRLNKPDGNYDVGLENAAIDDDEPEEPHVGYHGINFAGNSGAVITPRRVAASAPGVDNVQHSSDKGSYKPNMSFKPLYLGEVRKKLHPEESEDYVHTADTFKELVDRAFIQSSHEGMQLIMPSENSLHVKADLNVQRIDKKISTLEFPDVEYIGNTPSRTKSVVDSIQLSNFQLHLQKELGYHMVIIVAISLLCVFVLFKYLRHKKFSSRHRTKFV